MSQNTKHSAIVVSLFTSLFILNISKIEAQDFFKTHPSINPYQYEVVKAKAFQHAAVTSAHPLASMVGAAIMQEGGNAFDAAIATQYPTFTNPNPTKLRMQES